MKVFSIFSLIAIAHFAVIGTLFVQPGCQSKPNEGPDPSITRTDVSEPVVEEATPSASSELDPAFNAGLTGGETSSSSRQFAEPMRPVVDSTVTEQIDDNVLEPVLDPVADNIATGASATYTVVKGDTLSRIAKTNGVPLNDLLAANNLSKTSTIYVGQELIVPTTKVRVIDQTTPTASGETHTVQRGDNLSTIAKRYGVTVSMLKSVNRLSTDTIYVGQELIIPEVNGASPQRVSTPTPVQQEPVMVTASGSTYRVQRGDTPSGIAKRFGVSTASLMSVNGISDPRKLFVGQELKIPTGGSAESTASATPTRPQPRQSQPIAITQPTTQPAEQPSEQEDPMALLEALEDEDLPFAEVEEVNDSPESGN